MSRLWCVEHQENHTMTGNEVERVIYWTQWARADVIVNGTVKHGTLNGGIPGGTELSEFDDTLDHFQCPRDLLAMSHDPTYAGHEQVEDNVERRVAADQRHKAAGGTLK